MLVAAHRPIIPLQLSLTSCALRQHLPLASLYIFVRSTTRPLFIVIVACWPVGCFEVVVCWCGQQFGGGGSGETGLHSACWYAINATLAAATHAGQVLAVKAASRLCWVVSVELLLVNGTGGSVSLDSSTDS